MSILERVDIVWL